VALFLKIVVLAVLGVFVVQDFKGRSVFWFLPPVLAGAFIGLRYSLIGNFEEYWLPVIFNLNFIALLLIVTTAACSFRKRRLINVFKFLGLGDILFLAAIAFYLSALNFALFFVISSITVLFCWGMWRCLSGKIARFIPLAGFYAFFLACALICDWFLFHFNITDDFWLWHKLLY